MNRLLDGPGGFEPQSKGLPGSTKLSGTILPIVAQRR